LDIIVKKNGKGHTTCISKVLRENKEDVTELIACDTAEDFRSKKRKGDLIDCF
jgi:signal recognition particle GTPase